MLLVLGRCYWRLCGRGWKSTRRPMCTFIGMTLVMVWLAGDLWFFRPTAWRSLVCWRFVAVYQ
ncbi:hypothetical protein ACNKHT_22690 [Shigella flexneri]